MLASVVSRHLATCPYVSGHMRTLAKDRHQYVTEAHRVQTSGSIHYVALKTPIAPPRFSGAHTRMVSRAMLGRQSSSPQGLANDFIRNQTDVPVGRR